MSDIIVENYDLMLQGQELTGAEIKELRKRMGLSTGELARHIGITREYLYQIESGKKEPSDKIKLSIFVFANQCAGGVYMSAEYLRLILEHIYRQREEITALNNANARLKEARRKEPSPKTMKVVDSLWEQAERAAIQAAEYRKDIYWD